MCIYLYMPRKFVEHKLRKSFSVMIFKFIIIYSQIYIYIYIKVDKMVKLIIGQTIPSINELNSEL